MLSFHSAADQAKDKQITGGNGVIHSYGMYRGPPTIAFPWVRFLDLKMNGLLIECDGLLLPWVGCHQDNSQNTAGKPAGQ